MQSFEFEVRGVREKYPHNEFRSAAETRGKPLRIVDLAAVVDPELGDPLVRGDLFLRMTDAGEFAAGQRYRVTLEQLEAPAAAIAASEEPGEQLEQLESPAAADQAGE